MSGTAMEQQIGNLPLCDHIFVTTISVEKFEAVVARACRAPYAIEIQGADPTVLPSPRLFAVTFASLEDRDRVRIAMRFVEKEQTELAKQQLHAQPRRAPAVADA